MPSPVWVLVWASLWAPKDPGSVLNKGWEEQGDEEEGDSDAAVSLESCPELGGQGHWMYTGPNRALRLGKAVWEAP